MLDCFKMLRQAVKCRQFERPEDGAGNSRSAIAAIMKEFNDIVASAAAASTEAENKEEEKDASASVPSQDY